MKRSTNEKAAIILAVSVILSVTACSAEGVAYVDGNQSGTGFSSSSAATSGTIYEESTLPATVSVTTAATTTKAKETTAVLTTVASTPATTAEPKWKETKKIRRNVPQRIGIQQEKGISWCADRRFIYDKR